MWHKSHAIDHCTRLSGSIYHEWTHRPFKWPWKESILDKWARRTLRDDLVDGGPSLVGHEADDREDDEPGEDARAAVEQRHDARVPNIHNSSIVIQCIYMILEVMLSPSMQDMQINYPVQKITVGGMSKLNSLYHCFTGDKKTYNTHWDTLTHVSLPTPSLIPHPLPTQSRLCSSSVYLKHIVHSNRAQDAPLGNNLNIYISSCYICTTHG